MLMASEIWILSGKIKEQVDHSHNTQHEIKYLKKYLDPLIYLFNSTTEVSIGSRQEDQLEDKEDEIVDQWGTQMHQLENSTHQSTTPIEKHGNLDSSNYHVSLNIVL